MSTTAMELQAGHKYSNSLLQIAGAAPQALPSQNLCILFWSQTIPNCLHSEVLTTIQKFLLEKQLQRIRTYKCQVQCMVLVTLALMR